MVLGPVISLGVVNIAIMDGWILDVYFGDLAISPEVSTGETIWWSILAFIFGVLLLVSVTLVTASMFQRPIARLAENSNLSGLVSVLDFLSGTAEMFARGTFGVGSPNIYKNVIETDPRVKALEECMAQVSSSTQESIMRGVGASEQRIKANASAVAETFFATMQGMRSDHPSLGRMRQLDDGCVSLVSMCPCAMKKMVA